MREESEVKDMILLAIDSLGCIYGRTYIQKLFFLIENELFKDMDLNYIKYHYGPFSRELGNYIEDLKIGSLIKESINISNGHEGHCYELTAKGKNKVKNMGSKDNEKLREFCMQFKGYSPSELLKLVYSKYPAWTTNSV